MMLYVLPPPAAAGPPSPWSTILCDDERPSSVRGGDGGQQDPAVANGGRLTYRRNASNNRRVKAWLNAVQKNNRPLPRKPSVDAAGPEDSGAGSSLDEDEPIKTNRRLSECYFANKGSAAVLCSLTSHQQQQPQQQSRRKRHHHQSQHSHRHHSQSAPSSSRLSAGEDEMQTRANDIQAHLQSMFHILRPDDSLNMAVKLESVHSGRTRYLVVVSCINGNRQEESCLLGLDCNQSTTIGLVLRLLADTTITLDGDGGFSVSVCSRQHIFKPVSVQAMWSALQSLHRVSAQAREHNFFEGGLTHDWITHYEKQISSDQSCLNEWNAMDSIESRRPPSPDSLRTKPSEREETERVIRSALKEIMMSVDLDEVTSKFIRGRLEETLDMDLGEYKPFIDQEMLTVLGQMDAATQIFPHVYLGSEWNASNLDELNRNGVRHILNVTREIDNFFPGSFKYLNVRVYDDDKTDLLKHWDNTYKYITKAEQEGSKVLVHCKMGVSRSASVVIAYAMKAYNWSFKKAFDHVRSKRTCIKPNKHFILQLETYQGILAAMKNREKLQRSKSETNLVATSGLITPPNSPKKPLDTPRSQSEGDKDVTPPDRLDKENEPVVPSPPTRLMPPKLLDVSGYDLMKCGGRPKSWSPENNFATDILTNSTLLSQSLEKINTDKIAVEVEVEVEVPNIPPAPPLPTFEAHKYNVSVFMPCGNGLRSYSVSQNKIVQLQPATPPPPRPSSVKLRVNELESSSISGSSSVTSSSTVGCTSSPDRKSTADPSRNLVLNLTTQFEGVVTTSSPANSPSDDNVLVKPLPTAESPKFSRVAVNKPPSIAVCAPQKRDGGDLFSSRLDRVFEREERKQCREPAVDHQTTAVSGGNVSRQNSWSSFDSAVVLRDVISRHSSWGSCDTRTLPSRNSSWGSYDIRPTMQYVSERGEKPAAISTAASITKAAMDESCYRPAKRPKQKDQQKLLLPNCYSSSPMLGLQGASHKLANRVTASQPNISGLGNTAATNTVAAACNNKHSSLVRSLKEEFEAKAGDAVEKLSRKNSGGGGGSSSAGDDGVGNEHVKSLPTSPVSEHPKVTQRPSPAASMEDISVRKLVGKYENGRARSKTFVQDSGCPRNPHHQQQPPVPTRVSSLDVTAIGPRKFECNPVVKTVVLPIQQSDIRASVNRAANNKLQQGKSHPLTILPFKQVKVNSSVYNSM
ncbi:protein phosphatase Slingshot isoform X2 [Melanaphis sacchari]|uniref:protein phosphatase Slingshot isoform X2 n=1 Tax=Melanaphis sacchari TaxID=742174 RepID=UPI000DC143C2|nr:protein phosphatase Slingshot isoform X2 [Melanaphis sacchari]